MDIDRNIPTGFERVHWIPT